MKRFEFYEKSQMIKDCLSDYTYYGSREICDLLNNLVDENEQLKAINKYLIELLEYNGATVEIEHIKSDVE